MSGVSGLVHVEGAPATGAVVLLCVARDPWVLGAAVTGEDGGWEIPAPQGGVPDDAEVLVTLRGPVLGAAWRPVDEADGAWEVGGPFHELAIAAPGGVEAHLDPERLDALPERFRGYLKLRSATVEDAHFAVLALDGEGEAAVRVAPGRWIVGGGVPVPDGPLTPGPRPAGLAPMAAVQDGGAELPGSPHAGYDVEVSGDTRVQLRLGEVTR